MIIESKSQLAISVLQTEPLIINICHHKNGSEKVALISKRGDLQILFQKDKMNAVTIWLLAGPWSFYYCQVEYEHYSHSIFPVTCKQYMLPIIKLVIDMGIHMHTHTHTHSGTQRVLLHPLHLHQSHK